MAFDATAYGSCKLWLDADDITTLWENAAHDDQVDANNDSVYWWDDKSGNGNDLSESTNPPTYITTVQNNMPIVRFTGASTHQLSLGSALLTSSESEGALIVVAKHGPTKSYVCAIRGSSDILALRTQSDTTEHLLQGPESFDDIKNSRLSTDESSFHIYTLVWKAHSYVIQRCDGAESGLRSAGTTRWRARAPQRCGELSLASDMWLGAYGSGSSNGDCDIGEVIYYNRVPFSIVAIEEALQTKWNLSWQAEKI
jgi:hypothetical protein